MTPTVLSKFLRDQSDFGPEAGADERSWCEKMRAAANLIDQLTAPLSGDVGEIEREHETEARAYSTHTALFYKIDKLLRAIHSAESSKAESVRAAYEDAVTLIERAEVGNLLATQHMVICGDTCQALAEIIRARANGGK